MFDDLSINHRASAREVDPLRARFRECINQVRTVIVARLEVGAAPDEHRDDERNE